MTTVKDITQSLFELREDKETVQKWIPIIESWIHNDIIKKQLAISQDEWTKDMIDNNVEPLSVKDHVIYYLENQELISELEKEQSD